MATVQLKTLHKMRLPPLSEIRKHWHGTLEPEPEDEPIKPHGVRLTRTEWLDAIHWDWWKNDWPNGKPTLENRGNPDSELIRTLIHDPDYRRMYIDYLVMKRQEPTTLLLEELRRQGHRSVANEIMESVVIDSTDL